MYSLSRSSIFNQKTDNCKNNPEKSLTTKIGEHIPCK